MKNIAELYSHALVSRDPGELLQAIPYAKFLGLRGELDGEELLLVMPAQEQVIGNPILPAVHGGALGALLESTAIMKLLWDTQPTRVPKTINITVDYLRSARMRDTTARAELTKHGRRVATVTVRAFQDDEARPIAAAHAHFLLSQDL